MGYIYIITNKIDGKKYIGQTIEKDINERWKGHFKKSSNCRYLKNALDKYGKDNFHFSIICICFDNECDKYENEYMKKYNTIVPNGYNLREAGNNGNHNQETKNKIANSVTLYYSKFTDEEKLHYDFLATLIDHISIKFKRETLDDMKKAYILFQNLIQHCTPKGQNFTKKHLFHGKKNYYMGGSK